MPEEVANTNFSSLTLEAIEVVSERNQKIG